MKAEDLKTKTRDELIKILLDNRKEQFNLRFQRSQGSLENTAELRKSRRTIARVKTFLKQQNDDAAPGPAKGTTDKKKTPAKKKAPAKKASSKKAA